MGQRIPSGNKYDLLRQKAKQSVKAGEQEQQDAISRRYAALGMGGSGAAIKTQRDIQDKAQQNIQSANEAISFQEAAEQERKAEIEADRAFQRGEREATHLFARGEREATQKFASGESALARKFATQERMGGQKFASDEAKKARDLQNSQFKQQMAMSSDQFKKSMELAFKQFDLDKLISEANLRIQEKMANKKGIMDYATSPLNSTMRVFQGQGNKNDVIGILGGDIGGMSGGGSIICTDYYRNGWISEDVFIAAQRFSNKYVTRREKANYQAWAKGYLAMVEKLPILRHITWPIFSRCIYFMAGKNPFLGEIVYKLVFKYTTKPKKVMSEVAHGN